MMNLFKVKNIFCFFEILFIFSKKKKNIYFCKLSNQINLFSYKKIHTLIQFNRIKWNLNIIINFTCDMSQNEYNMEKTLKIILIVKENQSNFKRRENKRIYSVMTDRT
jgi:hypothetical protein